MIGAEGPRVRDVGEFGLIAAVTAGLGASERVPVSVGDDAAVLAPRGQVVVSTDSMVEDVHFKRAWSSAHDVGRKLVATSMADVVAMGARPLALVVAASLPTALPLAWASELMAGVRAEAELCGAELVGGDTTSGEKIALTATVIGDLEGRAPVLRSGAQVGDVIAYVGHLGRAEAGLAVLTRGFRSPKSVVGFHRTPQPPYEQGLVASDAGAHAMLDCSDGLVADLGHLAQASGVRIDLERARLVPEEDLEDVARALGGKDPLSFVLGGGDDHALLAAFAPADVPPAWTVIGRVEAGEPCVCVDGDPQVTRAGWTHF